MIITFIFVFLLGFGFLGYGVFLLMLPRICNERVKAVFSPETKEPRRMPFYVYRRNGQDIIAYQQNLPAIGATVPVRGETYDVYVSPSYPKLLITSDRIPFIQYLFSICLIILGIIILGIGSYAGFML